MSSPSPSPMEKCGSRSARRCCLAVSVLLLGTWMVRGVGLLDPGAPAAETFGVGLASGLMVLAAWWATFASGGRSSLTPVAVGFVISIALAKARRGRSPVRAQSQADAPSETVGDPAAPRWSRYRPMVLTALAGVAFIVGIAVLYGSTMALSARDGVQPVENVDEAYYSHPWRGPCRDGNRDDVLAVRVLAARRASDSELVPLGRAVARIDRHQDARDCADRGSLSSVVLPVLLLAAASLTGTVVRRLARTDSRAPTCSASSACLFLAPIPLVPGPFFSSWAIGLIFGITSYGLAAVAVLLALYGFAVLGGRTASWALAAFAGSAVSMIVPAHLVVAVLAIVGVGTMWCVRIAVAVATTRHLPLVSDVWRRTIIATTIALVATVTWGLLTGHTVGSSGVSPGVAPFNAFWRDSVAITILGRRCHLRDHCGLGRSSGPRHGFRRMSSPGHS